ncbi:nucleoside-binding protein [Kaistia soli DSM 19436]|uniref:Nucleoside-binding protein n=1 Tax=Kaistia soli DSM 19436 TaxID=1122133 RepID=A0A1M5HZR6_9HYPH|nr:BMP family ABC transporter substrate-binding protein [Kaistia soli]SHG21280.1 nucleoside-binding protein [Kaistia soli DSM 19436]
MSAFSLNRRTLLKSAAIGSLGLTTGLLTRRPAFAADLTIGIIYVGSRDDYGWNQAHAVAAKALAAVPGVKVVEEENVPETVAVAKTMESMVELDGAGLIFATSFGYYSPFMVDAAKKYPDVQFRHAAPLWTDKDPKNAGSYFGYLDQAHYIDGIAAGLSTKSNKLGFVAAKPISSVLSNINSFAIGARKVNPNATVQVIFTGDWSMPVREAEATNALIDAGCDVITCHVDSPKTVIQNAEAKGVKSCGHNASQADLAPKGFITGAEYKWETIYKQYADTLAKGGELPNFLSGGYDLDFVQNTPYGAGATPEAIKAADAAKIEMKAKVPVYVGPLKDNTGKEVIPAGTVHAPYDPWIDQINFLVEGVTGSIT